MLLMRLWRRLSLLARFTLTGLTLTIAIGLALGWAVGRELERSALDQEAASAADTVTLVLDPFLRPDDFDGAPSPERRAAIERFIRERILHRHIVRVKIWNASGVVVYSDDPAAVGQRQPVQDELGEALQLSEALQGRIATGISDLSKEENRTERDGYARLMEIYVPIRLGGDRVVGAYELYHDLEVVEPRIAATQRFLWASLVVALGGLYATLFGLVRRASRQLNRQNQELIALHRASLAISGDLGLESVLQKIVDEAGALVGARYGALLNRPASDDGTFVTAGVSAQERARIGQPPCGRGLLGVVLNEGEPLRLADLTADPRASGFPPHHPPMRSLVAVPIVKGGRVLGNLYLTEKVDAAEFSAADEETLARFATQAALAIENARLHRRVGELTIAEERRRIAHEMHDGLAQVLGYVNTKAQAAQEWLRLGQTARAGEQIGQLVADARAAYVDTREGILALRTPLDPERSLAETLREYCARWEELSGVTVELVVSPEGASPSAWRLAPLTELQLLRIVQEALANVRKHAGVAHARVQLRYGPGWTEVMVSDEGAGFDPAAPLRDALPHFGLAMMKERAEAVGGTLEVDAASGRGTRVVVRVPTASSEVYTGGIDARANR
jgi:nitrate/nitrite-specific signal transduction histidine kinase